MPLEPIIVGREPKELAKFGTKGTVFLGKHVVGSGFESHMTNPVQMDMARPHVVLIVGKRGSGKSYTGAVLAEEVMLQPAEIRDQLSVVMIDTMGIFWSMKEPNDPAMMLLKEWEMEPKSFPVQNVVPHGLADFYKRQSIAFDTTFAVKPNELSAGDWALTFGVSIFEPLGILLERAIRGLQGKEYSIGDIVKAIDTDKRAEEKDKAALANRFAGAEGWGIFAKEATPIEKFIKPGIATILDVSLQDWPVRNLTVGLLARKLYAIRLAARREEEEATIAGEIVRKVPLTWLIMDEAHNFLPAEGETAATGPLLTLLRQGRQPGISTVFITQRPLKLHEDAVAQSDLVIAHRLTAQPDLAALSTVMQSYALEDIRKLVTELPKQPGSAVLLDDNSERLFAIQVRPRMSWHAGGTPTALK
jgi:hypothetical protein